MSARDELKKRRHIVTVLNPDGTWCKENQAAIVDACEAYEIAERLLDAIEAAVDVLSSDPEYGGRMHEAERILERALKGEK